LDLPLPELPLHLKAFRVVCEKICTYKNYSTKVHLLRNSLEDLCSARTHLLMRAALTTFPEAVERNRRRARRRNQDCGAARVAPQTSCGTSINTYIRPYIHTYIHIYIHTYIYRSYYIHTYVHTYIHTYTGLIRGHVGFGGTGTRGCGAASAAIPHAWSAGPGCVYVVLWLTFTECVCVWVCVCVLARIDGCVWMAASVHVCM